MTTSASLPEDEKKKAGTRVDESNFHDGLPVTTVATTVAAPSLVGTDHAFGRISDDDEPVHLWFNLTYASYLVLPRSVLQSTPAEWQRRFVRCLEDLGVMCGGADLIPEGTHYDVFVRDARGRRVRDDLADYQRGRRRVPLKELPCPSAVHEGALESRIRAVVADAALLASERLARHEAERQVEYWRSWVRFALADAPSPASDISDGDLQHLVAEQYDAVCAARADAEARLAVLETARQQVDLSPATAKVLHDNAWKLYGDDAVETARHEPHEEKQG